MIDLADRERRCLAQEAEVDDDALGGQIGREVV